MRTLIADTMTAFDIADRDGALALQQLGLRDALLACVNHLAACNEDLHDRWDHHYSDRRYAKALEISARRAWETHCGDALRTIIDAEFGKPGFLPALSAFIAESRAALAAKAVTPWNVAAFDRSVAHLKNPAYGRPADRAAADTASRAQVISDLDALASALV